MMETKFVIVTTLCYVGIVGVIFIVCCCAWIRHRRKEHRGFSSQQRSRQTNRRFYRPVQPPQYHAPSTPMTYGAPRGNQLAEEIQNITDGRTYSEAPQASNAVARGNLYPKVNVGYHPNPVFAGHQRGNLYPSNVTTGTHTVQITTCGETNANQTAQRFSVENGSEVSSRFDGGHSVVAETDDKNSASNSRKPPRSVNSELEAESDVSTSQVSHFQEISLREERC